MSAALDLDRAAVLPETDREAAAEASRAVSRLVGRGAVRVEAVPVRDGDQRQTFILPAPAVKLLTEMLVHLGKGCPVTVFPDHAELTTQQAADFLNVSRPWIVKLIDKGELPCHMVGTHRRVLFADLIRYKGQMKASQRAALDELVEEAQAMGDYE